MILTCPACQTRYLVDDAAVGGEAGRAVRCAKCGHSWHFVPEPAGEAAETPEAAVLQVPRLEPGLDAPPLPAGPLPPPAPPRRRAAWVGIGWLALLLLVAAAVLGGILARDRVVAVWPPAARLYAAAGLRTGGSGAGLEIRKVVPTRTADGLVIEGDIANIGGSAQEVPRLRVALLDTGKKEIQFKIIDPPKTRLAPGEVAHFKAPFQQSDDAATKVAVTFASG